ncbi:unnamed protein product [Scytosiphon promiscuus]
MRYRVVRSTSENGHPACTVRRGPPPPAQRTTRPLAPVDYCCVRPNDRSVAFRSRSILSSWNRPRRSLLECCIRGVGRSKRYSYLLTACAVEVSDASGDVRPEVERHVAQTSMYLFNYSTRWYPLRWVMFALFL